MTIELKLRRAADLFVDNEVYCLRRGAPGPDIKLAGAAWIIARQPVKTAHLLTLKHATALVLSKLEGYSLWLLAGHTCWQENSRITRHRKLWSYYKTRGLPLPFDQGIGESLVETDKGLRYFDALQFGPNSLEPVLTVLHEEPISHLVALHPEHRMVVDTLVRNGWERPHNSNAPSWDVLKAICNSDGVVFWPVGAFDDIEAGTVAFANSSVLEQMLGS